MCSRSGLLDVDGGGGGGRGGGLWHLNTCIIGVGVVFNGKIILHEWMVICMYEKYPQCSRKSPKCELKRTSRN